MTHPSPVTEVPPADSASAFAHFSACLQFETDCWDVHAAMGEAFDAVRRKLEDYARKQRGDVKQHSQPKA